MPSFPQIACHSNKAILSFGNPDDFFRRHPGSVSPQPLSPSMVPGSLQRLEISLGREFSEHDDQALLSSLEHIRSHCRSLESVSVTANAKSWVERAVLVRKWGSPPLVLYKERIIDPEWNSEVLTRRRRRGLQWEHASHISFPVDRVNELADSVCQIPHVIRLSLLGQPEPLTNRRLVVRDLTQLLRRLPDLRKVSLPLELSSRIGLLLTIVSSLPHCCALKLSISSTLHVTEAFCKDLIGGFRQFDHLRKLCLPANILCDSLLVCLGELLGLQKLTIIATSPVPVLSAAMPNSFPVLRTLKLFGSKNLSSDLETALRAFAPPHSTTLRRVFVDAAYLSHRNEMRDTLNAIVQYRGAIEELGIRINGMHRLERRDWMELSQLKLLRNIRMLGITHSRPLPLTDGDVGHFITAYPLAKFLSFNPRPTLPPWYSPISHSPTLNCLRGVVTEGSNLHHFGIYLDPRPSYNSNLSSHTNLQELDLGEVVVSKKKAALLLRLFPNAKRL